MPEPNMKDFLLKERGLDKVVRFSSLMRLKDESVAEHSFHAAFYAMMLADMEIRNGKKVDVERVLRSALIHDLEEAVTGDILHGFKHSDPELKRKINEMGLEFFKKMLSDVPELAGKYTEIWERGKEEGIEGEIVEAADKIEALIYSYEEMSTGNKNFREVARKLIDVLEKSNLQSVKMFVKEIQKIEV